MLSLTGRKSCRSLSQISLCFSKSKCPIETLALAHKHIVSSYGISAATECRSCYLQLLLKWVQLFLSSQEAKTSLLNKDKTDSKAHIPTFQQNTKTFVNSSRLSHKSSHSRKWISLKNSKESLSHSQIHDALNRVLRRPKFSCCSTSFWVILAKLHMDKHAVN